MRPCMDTPLIIRGAKFGGPKCLFCAPLVAQDLGGVLAQADVAHELKADLVEWRADFFREANVQSIPGVLKRLRDVLPEEPVIFTLRKKSEGGATEMAQDVRRALIEQVAATRLADIIDIELSNEIPWIESVVRAAHENCIRVILSCHDYERTPPDEELQARIGLMKRMGADVAKIAVMPQNHADVLRLLEVTLMARSRYPGLALCTMAMGPLGILSRVAGFLFGSDMAYAIAQASSAPGQIPITEARNLAEGLLKYAGEPGQTA